MASGLTYRGATAAITDAVVQAINLAYRARHPAVADLTALRGVSVFGADGSQAVSAGVIRYVTAESVCYRWDSFSIVDDDGSQIIAPTGVGVRPGRWIRCSTGMSGINQLRLADGTPIEKAQTGYLRATAVYAGEKNQAEFEKRIYGQRPAIIVDFVSRSKERKSTLQGGLAWATYHFEIDCVSFCARADEKGVAGSPLPAEALLDPGAWAMAEDLEQLLDGALGEQFGIPAIDHCKVGEMRIVERDLSGRLAIVSLDLEVYATIGRQDSDASALSSVYAQPEVAINRPGDTALDPDNVIISGLVVLQGMGLARAPTNGTAKIAGATVTVAGATLHTFTANSDTYRDLKSDGTFVYHSVPHGSNAPAVTASALRIGKTVTDGSGVVLDTLLAPTLRNFGAAFQIYPTP